MISTVSSSMTIGSLYASGSGRGDARASDAAGSDKSQASSAEKTASQQKADERTIAELAATDRKVHAHEAAHLAAAQGLAISGASFSYTTGPDGKRYAVGGEVNIDTSEAKTPAETIIKAGHIRRAAMAPVDPSAQDRSVAAMADRMAANARLELNREQAASYTRSNTPALGSQVDIAA
ncbi:putative metalloprotease CJM1_0395 family protein [Uliginosibacterium sp. 31-16]|uniref:putative metalloprotease CJM1_0395 family protein n=1 Tax=Uliginosibacterium sp. 31-16 TaxID=3068315 RepID=UPI00273DD3CF|nr:putative metalloprotease CJM1_0395 family protein [Uliginosibacterium sp. 31-16]MDP5238133.1 putative metalloprotease CJM1_0395 family protein [Uliginosibacterium sp. 31-16]